MNTSLLIILFLIAALYILEPEFFGLLPEWLTLWGKMMNLYISRKMLAFRLRRQIAKDRKEFDRFTREILDDNRKEAPDRL